MQEARIFSGRSEEDWGGVLLQLHTILQCSSLANRSSSQCPLMMLVSPVEAEAWLEIKAGGRYLRQPSRDQARKMGPDHCCPQLSGGRGSPRPFLPCSNWEPPGAAVPSARFSNSNSSWVQTPCPFPWVSLTSPGALAVRSNCIRFWAEPGMEATVRDPPFWYLFPGQCRGTSRGTG